MNNGSKTEEKLEMRIRNWLNFIALISSALSKKVSFLWWDLLSGKFKHNWELFQEHKKKEACKASTKEAENVFWLLNFFTCESSMRSFSSFHSDSTEINALRRNIFSDQTRWKEIDDNENSSVDFLSTIFAFWVFNFPLLMFFDSYKNSTKKLYQNLFDFNPF